MEAGCADERMRRGMVRMGIHHSTCAFPMNLMPTHIYGGAYGGK